MSGGFFDQEPDAPAQVDPKSYDVGYRKPPAGSRFKSGRSGNPAGRPKKEKKKSLTADEAFGNEMAATLILEEAYRPVLVREGGKTTEMPTIQAVMLSLNRAAIKGDRIAAKTVLKYVKAAEREDAKKIELLNHKAHTYLEYTRLQSRRAKARGMPEPALEGPHPGDMHFNPKEGMYEIDIFTPEEEKKFAKIQEQLDELQEEITAAAQDYSASDDPEEKQRHLSYWLSAQSMFDTLQSLLPDGYRKALKNRSLEPGASKRDGRPRHERLAAHGERLRAEKAAE